jgi:hypothetical protein
MFGVWGLGFGVWGLGFEVQCCVMFLVQVQATSPSLLFVSGDSSFVEVVPKCAIGTFVSSGAYVCIK